MCGNWQGYYFFYFYFYCNLFCYLLTYLFTYLFFYFLLCINIVNLLSIKIKKNLLSCVCQTEKVSSTIFKSWAKTSNLLPIWSVILNKYTTFPLIIRIMLCEIDIAWLRVLKVAGCSVNCLKKTSLSVMSLTQWSCPSSLLCSSS